MTRGITAKQLLLSTGKNNNIDFPESVGIAVVVVVVANDVVVVVIVFVVVVTNVRTLT